MEVAGYRVPSNPFALTKVTVVPPKMLEPPGGRKYFPVTVTSPAVSKHMCGEIVAISGTRMICKTFFPETEENGLDRFTHK